MSTLLEVEDPGSETASGRDVEIADIAGSDEGFVAVAGNHVWTSPDGITWTSASTTFGPDDQLRGVIAGGPGLVAFGEDGVSHRAAIWTSPDGYVWLRVPDDPEMFNGEIYAITGGGPGLVAVGPGPHPETRRVPNRRPGRRLRQARR